jgi:hypothetical protein
MEELTNTAKNAGIDEAWAHIRTQYLPNTSLECTATTTRSESWIGVVSWNFRETASVTWMGGRGLERSGRSVGVPIKGEIP